MVPGVLAAAAIAGLVGAALLVVGARKQRQRWNTDAGLPEVGSRAQLGCKMPSKHMLAKQLQTPRPCEPGARSAVAADLPVWMTTTRWHHTEYGSACWLCRWQYLRDLPRPWEPHSSMIQATLITLINVRRKLVRLHRTERGRREAVRGIGPDAAHAAQLGSPVPVEHERCALPHAPLTSFGRGFFYKPCQHAPCTPARTSTVESGLS